MRTPIVLLGAGGFAREVYDWVNLETFSIVALFSENSASGTGLYGTPVINNLSNLKLAKFVVAVGDPLLKMRFVELAIAAGLEPAPPIIHRSAVLGRGNKIGLGSVICPFVCVTTNTDIGKYTVLNLSSTVGHDTSIGEYSTVSPGANISGNCAIGDACYIGTNSAIREKVTIGNHSTVGMGAVVTKSHGMNLTLIGSPARPVAK